MFLIFEGIDRCFNTDFLVEIWNEGENLFMEKANLDTVMFECADEESASHVVRCIASGQYNEFEGTFIDVSPNLWGEEADLYRDSKKVEKSKDDDNNRKNKKDTDDSNRPF